MCNATDSGLASQSLPTEHETSFGTTLKSKLRMIT